MPKSSVTQPRYEALLGTEALVFAAPSCLEDITLTGRVISYLNAASYGVLLKEQMEDRVKTALRDDLSRAMFLRIGFSARYDYTAGLLNRSESDARTVLDAVRQATRSVDGFTKLLSARAAIVKLLEESVISRKN